MELFRTKLNRVAFGLSITGASLLSILFTAPSGAIDLNYTYDALGRLTQVNAVNGYSIAYGYDAAGNRSSETVTPGVDSDGDGLTDFAELNIYGTNPGLSDSDGDGLADADELFVYFTDPLLADTDGDGYSDKDEIDGGSDPLDSGSFPASTTIANYRFTVLNPALVSGDVGVVSLADANTVIAGATTLNLDQYDYGVIPAGSLLSGDVITGLGPFDLGGSVDGTDQPLPPRLSGTRFVMPHVRNTHAYYLLSPEGNASAQIDVGGVITPVTLPQGQVIEVNAGSNNTVSALITSDLPILVAHRNTNGADASPVLPAALEVWGVRSTGVYVGALEDNTTISVYADNGTSVQNVVLNAGARYTVNVGASTSEGQGSGLRIVADKPIGAVQSADSDGSEQTAFTPTRLLATRFGIPTNAQYVAVVCSQPDTTVTLYDSPSAPDARACGGDATSPGKLYFGSSTDGTNIAAGAYLESNRPVHVIYEDAVHNDEHNLIGHLPTDNQYWVLNPNLETGNTGVVSLADDNLIVAGNTVLNLDDTELAALPSGTLPAGTLIRGSGPFDVSASIDQTDVPAHQSLLGTAFVMPQVRDGHIYSILSPEGIATVNVDVAGSVTTVTASKGQVVEVDVGANNSASAIITSDLPVLVSHRGDAGGDSSPVPPAATEIWGIRSGSAYLGALENNTSVSIYAEDGTSVVDVVLNAGSRYTVSVGVAASQSTGSGLRVVADKPVGGIQLGDADGYEQAAFFPTGLLATRYGIPTGAQYLAVVCPEPGTNVTLHDGANLPDTRSCAGNGLFPGKVYFGSSDPGVHIGAGAYLESDKPVHAVYEDNATGDERNLIGHGPLSYHYRVLNPGMAGASTGVVSLVDGNTIVAGATVLNLDRYEYSAIPAGVLTQGVTVSGTGAFDIGGDVSATDMPMLTGLAANRFALPHVRNNHLYYLLSPYADASVDIDVGGVVTTVALTAGQVASVNVGGNNSVSAIISSDLPILATHRTDNGLDASALVPLAKELWGVRSNSVYIGAVEDNTTVSIYADNGSTTQGVVLNAGARYTVGTGVSGSQGSGSGLRIVADKPIAAVQSADADGGEQTAFLPTSLLATRFAIPANAQYIAIVCSEPNTAVTLHDGANPPDARDCGGDGVTPGKLFFGSTANGVHINAGAYLESNRPVYVIYENAASNDEHNLMGAQ